MSIVDTVVFMIGDFMKKYFILLFFLMAGVARASSGEHFNFSHELISAFEKCALYNSKELKKEDLAKNDIVEEYTSIDIIGQQGDKCVFDLILQMQSVRLYAKTVKRCKVTPEQQKLLLDGMRNTNIDGGKRFNKEIVKIIDQMGCHTVSDIQENMPGYEMDKGYIIVP